MKKPMPYLKVVARVLFLGLVFWAVIAPKLSSPDPGRFLSGIKQISVATWITLFLLFLAILWLYYNLKQATFSAESQNTPDFIQSIEEAVKENNGGNGLASSPFNPTLKWFNLLGWINVKEPEKEAVVIDGIKTIKKTQLYFAPMRLLGKPLNARRVLLSPSPLVDIKANGLTSDELDLTLVITVKYSVINPAYVASLSAPLSELKDIITGTLIEQIHSSTLEDIVKDDGTLRLAIKAQLDTSSTIINNYKIEGVLKALPTGDERIIEIIRQTREAYQKKALLTQEGQNKVIAAGYDIEIEKAKVTLQEEIKQLQFEREKELLKLTSEFQVMQETMRSIAQIAASGVSPAAALKEIRTLFVEREQEPIQALLRHSDEPLIKIEQEQLQSISEKFGFKSFILEPYPGKNEQPGKAVIVLDDYSILLNCSPEYPSVPPTVQMKIEGISPIELIVAWFSGSNLGDAVTSAILQARSLQSKRK